MTPILAACTITNSFKRFRQRSINEQYPVVLRSVTSVGSTATIVSILRFLLRRF